MKETAKDYAFKNLKGFVYYKDGQLCRKVSLRQKEDYTAFFESGLYCLKLSPKILYFLLIILSP